LAFIVSPIPRRVWPGRAGANGNAVADAGNLDRRRRRKPRFGGAVLENVDGNDTKIERRVRGGLLDQAGCGIEMNDELVTGGALELRAEFAQRAGH
jgi:hypothetical protein